MAGSAQRVVVTGATGLIGSKLVARLRERGDSVVALVRDVGAARARFPGVECLQWSSSAHEGSWRSAIDGADAVINLAGAPVAKRWNDRQKALIGSTRVEATRNIVRAIAAASGKPAVLVSASAVGYYGTSATATFNEHSPHGSDLLGRSCAAWEAEAHAAEELGVRVAIVRIGIVLDPSDGALGKLLPAFRLFAGAAIAPGTQWFPWVHIDDVIGMLLWSLDSPKISGPVNAIAPGIVTNREFSRTLGKVLRRPAFLKVPKFVVRLILGDGAYILTEGQRAVPERALELGFRFNFVELKPALEDLLNGRTTGSPEKSRSGTPSR